MDHYNRKPADIHPELTEDRLKAVGAILKDTRHACLERHDEKAGDTNWSYGCRARDWVRMSLRNAVKSGQYPWLEIQQDGGQKFVLGIGGLPIKFFKDDPEEPSDRVQKVSVVEAAQGSLFEWAGLSAGTKVKWRFLIETGDASKTVTRIVFAGFNQYEERVCFYNIPLEPTVATLYEFGAKQEDGVVLASPEVNLKKRENEEQRNGATDAARNE